MENKIKLTHRAIMGKGKSTSILVINSTSSVRYSSGINGERQYHMARPPCHSSSRILEGRLDLGQ